MVAANSLTMARPSPAPRVATTESPTPTEEAGEDLLSLGLGDARALVVDRELGAAAVLSAPRRGWRCRRGSTSPRCPRGWRRRAPPPGPTPGRRARGRRLVHHLVVGGQVGLLVEDAGHDLTEVQDGVAAHHPGTALEPREVQEVLDQGAETLGVAVDLLGVQARLLGAEAVPAGGQELRVAGDRADRRPQLVRGGRQEHRLQLVHRPHPVQQLALLREGLGVREGRGQHLGGRPERAQVVAVEVAAGDHPEPGDRAPAPAQDQAQRLSGGRRPAGSSEGGDGGRADAPGEELPFARTAVGDAQRQPVEAERGRRARW